MAAEAAGLLSHTSRAEASSPATLATIRCAGSTDHRSHEADMRVEQGRRERAAAGARARSV